MSNHNLPICDAVNASLDSVEAALARLLESVASYNPSPEAATALVQADEALTDTLDTLEYHQSSHNRILELRSTTAELDQQLTDLLEALAETRQETLKCPGTTFENNLRDVPYTELLDYASKISKFSQPPNPMTFRKQVLSLRAAALVSQTAGQQPDSNAPLAEEQAKEKLPLGLTAEDALLADPFSGQQFAPWPSEQEMKSGALVTLQNGQMPWDMAGEEEKKRVEREREREERRARGEYVPENEDEEVDKKEERRSIAVGGVLRMGGSGVAGAEAKEKINLSLDLYDPDDED